MKSLLVYFIAFLMFSTSALYFSVAIFGEKIETNEAHGLQIAEGQTEGETTESGHIESQELAEQEHVSAQELSTEFHNESSETPEERMQEGLGDQHGNETTTNQTEVNKPQHIEGKGIEEGLHQESASETQRKNLEFSLSIGTGVGYAAIGLWMILDRRNSKIPYGIAIIGSVALLAIYVASRTIGISSLGLEPVGLLDLIVGMLQGGIIAGSLYILITKTYNIQE